MPEIEEVKRSRTFTVKDFGEEYVVTETYASRMSFWEVENAIRGANSRNNDEVILAVKEYILRNPL